MKDLEYVYAEIRHHLGDVLTDETVEAIIKMLKQYPKLESDLMDFRSYLGDNGQILDTQSAKQKAKSVKELQEKYEKTEIQNKKLNDKFELLLKYTGRDVVSCIQYIKEIEEELDGFKKALTREINIAKQKLDEAEKSGNDEHEQIATYVLNSLQIVEGTHSHDHEGGFIRGK